MAYYKITTDKKGNLKAKIQVYGNDFDTDGKKLYTKTIYRLRQSSYSHKTQ